MPDTAVPDAFSPTCGSRAVLDLIADKWSALLLYALLERTRRHTELQRMVGGVSQKMLTQTLRRLEADGIVRRDAFAVMPPRVEYSLTDLGRSLAPILRELCVWAEDHLPEVERHRAGAGQAPRGAPGSI